MCECVCVCVHTSHPLVSLNLQVALFGNRLTAWGGSFTDSRCHRCTAADASSLSDGADNAGTELTLYFHHGCILAVIASHTNTSSAEIGTYRAIADAELARFEFVRVAQCACVWVKLSLIRDYYKVINNKG